MKKFWILLTWRSGSCWTILDLTLKNSPVIRGSALLALKGDTSKYGTPSVQYLLDAIDSYFSPPKRDYTSPFILPCDNTFNVPGRGTVVVGTVKRGIVKKGMEAELIGFDERIKTVVTDVQVYLLL